ncbi:uncharacterized protein LOC122626206 [Drosophila teissieri]|uniref:uncharacterized protein LOC122626206 n=1 Tax=Drosophila teissieri TaxID=7243 RepID=UPI001CBA42CD|nr:uncharacterized protein LOC122626206 [Drosophila teissieri]
MREYIVLFAFLVILKTSLCSNERLENIVNGYGQLIEAKEQELILLELHISDLQKKLDELKTNSVNILDLDQLRRNLMEKEEQLMVCESNSKTQSAPGFWNTVKEIIKPKLEEKLKFLSANNVEANAQTMSKQEEANESSTWDWKDIPRQIVLYYSGN